MKKRLAFMLVLSMAVGTVLTGCGGTSGDAAQTTADTAEAEPSEAGSDAEGGETDTDAAAETESAADTNLVYAVEAGSAGEAAAQDKGFQTNVVASQADALMEVASGTSDAAIIDLLMAGAMIGEGTSYPNMNIRMS